MLQPGLVSAILAQYDTEELIRFAGQNGFTHLEMMCWPKGTADRRYAGVTHLDVEHLDTDRVATLNSQLQEHGVSISGLGYYPNPLDPDQQKSAVYIAHLHKVIRAAGQLGVPVVNTFVGRDPQKSVEDNITRFRELWPSIIAAAEQQGVKIAIENCPMFFTMDEWPGGKNLATTPVIWDRLFEIIPSPNFGLNYDPSHFVWQMMDPIQPLYDYSSRIFHVHVKDAKIHREKLNRAGIMATPLEYHSPRIPGRGDVDWKAFFKTLHDIGYAGPVCIEVEDKDFETGIEGIQNAILQARDHIIPYL